MARTGFLVLCLALAVASCHADSIGDSLERTAFIYKSLPLDVDTATSQGWQCSSECDPNLGYACTLGSGPSNGNPMTLYYDNSNNIAGVGMTVFEDPPEPLMAYWLSNGDGTYTMSVTFRNDTCNGQSQAGSLGDQLVINQGNENAVSVPTNAADAANAGWTKGSCINTMGTHWGYDITGTMTYNSSTLLPLIPMFDYTSDSLSAIMFNFPHAQRFEPLGIWEGPIFGALMCKNFCSSECNSFDGVSIYSTLHVWTTDPHSHSCPTSIYCPPSN